MLLNFIMAPHLIKMRLKFVTMTNLFSVPLPCYCGQLILDHQPSSVLGKTHLFDAEDLPAKALNSVT